MIFNINSTRGHTGSLLVLTKERVSELFAKYQFGAIHTAGITDGKVTGKPSHESGTLFHRIRDIPLIHCAMIMLIHPIMINYRQ